MIVVDSSALIAILLDEPDSEDLGDRAARATSVLVSAATLVEARMVALSRIDEAGVEKLTALLVGLDAEIVPFDAV